MHEVLAVSVPPTPCMELQLHMSKQLTLNLRNASIIKGSSDG